MSFARYLAVALAMYGLVATGCQYVPVASKSKLDSVTAQNRTLCEQNRAQLAEIENLKVHKRNVEDQLIHAEEDLAKLDAEVGRDRQKLTNYKNERARLKNQAGSLAGSGLSNAIPPDLSGRLADLADRYPSLQYDPKTGISKLDTDVLFDSAETDLKPGAEKLLGEFAQIFQAPQARELKIMVVGHTDARAIKGREARAKHPTNWHLSASRALAVADRLREAGMPEDRMGVAGFGQHQPISPNDTAESRQKNRRVEIFVVGPETPVVGWTETLGTVYR